MIKVEEVGVTYQEMKSAFMDLEFKYITWFDDHDSFIEDYFIDSDLRKDFIDGCEMPEHIKLECALIKSRFGFAIPG